jgi:hypothetical protein
VGCFTAIIGLVGGGMLGVMVAKIATAAQSCTNAFDPRTPCDWTTYWTWGARIGVFVVPTVSIWRMWVGRHRPRNNG